MNSRLKKKLEDNGYADLINYLSNELTESELNSLLMEVFDHKSKIKTASRVLKDYVENRFSKPASINPVKSTELELSILKTIEKAGFEVLEFSPLAPFGTSSVHGAVHQNNVVSTTRRMEVVSDVTNVMALEISKRLRAHPHKENIELAAVQRQVRAQGFDDPKFAAHFKIAGLTSSWVDKGKFIMDEKFILKHISTYLNIFKDVYGFDRDQLILKIGIISKNTDVDFERFLNGIAKAVEGMDVKKELIPSNSYYSNLRFGIQIKSMHYPIVDGGFVNWLSDLTQNKKRRLLISGIGTDLMYKIKYA